MNMNTIMDDQTEKEFKDIFVDVCKKLWGETDQEISELLLEALKSEGFRINKEDNEAKPIVEAPKDGSLKMLIDEMKKAHVEIDGEVIEKCLLIVTIDKILSRAKGEKND